MAMGPICIITPSGMICSSSRPMKRHFPKPQPPGDEPVTTLASKVYDDVFGALAKDVPDPKLRDVYATACQLIAQGSVTLKTPFTITATADNT